MVYSKKQHMFLVVYEFSGSANEVVVYRENTEFQTANSKCTTVKGLFGSEILNFSLLLKYLNIHVGELISHSWFAYSSFAGRDAAFIGPNENQFAILDDDKTGLALYILPGKTTQESNEKKGAVEENQTVDNDGSTIRGPVQFLFEDEADRIFSTPLGEQRSTFFNKISYFILFLCFWRFLREIYTNHSPLLL